MTKFVSKLYRVGKVTGLIPREFSVPKTHERNRNFGNTKYSQTHITKNLDYAKNFLFLKYCYYIVICTDKILMNQL